jgi:hypothetical protein
MAQFPLETLANEIHTFLGRLEAVRCTSFADPVSSEIGGERCKIMAGAQASGLLTGRPVELAEQFAGAALARFDGQPAARRRRATEPPRNRATCPRRRSCPPATSSATE